MGAPDSVETDDDMVEAGRQRQRQQRAKSPDRVDKILEDTVKMAILDPF